MGKSPFFRVTAGVALLCLTAVAWLGGSAAGAEAAGNEADAYALQEAPALATQLQAASARLCAVLERASDAASADAAAAELVRAKSVYLRLITRAAALQNGLSLEAQLRFNQLVFGAGPQGAPSLHTEFERLSEADFYGSSALRTEAESLLFPSLGEAE